MSLGSRPSVCRSTSCATRGRNCSEAHSRVVKPYLNRTFLQPQTSPWPQPSRLAGPTSEGWQVMRASHAAADARIVPAVTSSTIHPVAG